MAALDALAASHWAATAKETFGAPQLIGDHVVDVAIIGGGILGVFTALRLAEAGVSVALVEAGKIGAGASGRNGGLVVPSLPRLSPDAAIARLGTHGKGLVRMIAGGADTVFSLIKQHAIACDGTQAGWLNPAHGPSLVDGLKVRCRAWANAGAKVRFLEADEARERIGSPHFFGAILDETGGHMNPLAYARGGARAAAATGALVFEQSPAVAVTAECGRWLVRTPGGTVRCRALLQATNGQPPGVGTGDDAATVPLSVHQMVTQIWPDEVRRSVLGGGEALSDTRHHLFAIRWTADGRLGIGGMAPLGEISARARVAKVAARRLAGVFAHLEGARIQGHWRAHAMLTGDFLPRLHQLGERRYAVSACNGRGIVMATVLGAALADVFAGKTTAFPLRPAPPSPIRFRSLAGWVPKLLLPFATAADKRAER
ncbi:MAG: FAD-binding oxidoreductase [Devosia sp.]